ncbi:hypothetical protein TDB9533_03396 [Thalassocella blandensis]|nr:hypothetical protein TDB9533_03396 [Thalassocella blandensis]
MRILLLALVLLTSNVFASEATKQEKLKELINVMDMDSMVDSMYSQMEVMMQNMSTEMGVQPEEQPIFDEYYSKMTMVMREEISWKKMKPTVLEIYDKNFSEQEISDMLAFYKTETGQAILAKMPAVMQESMLMSQSLAQNAVPKIQVIAKELYADLEVSRSKKK